MELCSLWRGGRWEVVFETHLSQLSSLRAWSSQSMFFGTVSSFIKGISFPEIEAKREAILFLFHCSEVNSTWIITSGLANQRAPKAIFTCVVYTNNNYCLRVTFQYLFLYMNMYMNLNIYLPGVSTGVYFT